MPPTNSPHYAKSFAVKSIMRNPKLAKVLFDAWDAPVGSTKAAHARMIMKSLERSANNYANDGRGGPGIQQNPFATLIPNTQKSQIQNPISPVAPKIGPQPMPFSSSTPSRGITPAPDTTFTSTPKMAPLSEEQPKNKIFVKTIPKDWTQAKKQMELDAFNRNTQEQFPKTQQLFNQAEQPQGVVPTATISPTEVAGNVTTGYKDILDKYGITTNPADTPDYLSAVEKATKAGIGGKTFSAQALADKDMLSTILQLPKESLAWLPSSGFLSDYLVNLRDETKKRYQLDGQLQRILDLQKRGANIEGDLQAYVRGKDTYLGKLDKLYTDATQKFASMDTSDPNDAKRAGNYLNYLTILKGRQNQRYIDFVNSSVQQHNAELTQATDVYKYTKDKFDEEYAQLKDGATEKYGALKDMLTEMYDNVDKREQTLYTDQKQQLDLINSAIQIDTNIIENQQKKNEVSGVKLPNDFYSYTSTMLNELQAGSDWGSIWNKVKQRYPNASNQDIDTALGGGMVKTEAEAKALDPNSVPVKVGEEWAWGWAKPGAYEAEKPATSSTQDPLAKPKEYRMAKARVWLITKYDGVNPGSGGEGMDTEQQDKILATNFGLTASDLY